jgi:cytochrome c oxidase cbb3-type subunit 3
MLNGDLRALLIVAGVAIPAFVFAQQAPSPSPASKPPAASKTRQSYPAQQIQAGQTRFAAQCGFCHGRDAAGGESGPDLTRSPLVAEDVRGNKIGPAVRQGNPEKGMPAFPLNQTELTEVVAFIHDAKAKAESASGGRRSVDVEDLQTGNAEEGKRYFNGAGGCATCHTITGAFATVGARVKGLALLQRMLYPGSGGREAGPAPAPPRATVTTHTGETVSGALAYRDEFTVSLTDSDGWTRSWPANAVKIEVDDRLRAHIDQLGKYTDDDMHNVFAYLQTLK